jgi:enamine deaminase RidA (YjgF/YER057c/UK114 family)
METIERKLSAMGLVLPSGAPPAANYLPFIRSHPLLFISGQLPLRDGRPAFAGRLGDGVSIEDGYAAARLCAINIIAQIKAAGCLERVHRVVRLGGFVSATTEFTDHPKVVNGASDLFVEVFGEAGRHARAAVGVSSLPFGVPVEVDAVIEITN